VYVVRGDKAARVSVKLGYYDGPWVEVRSGLKPGDRVVTAGKVALREGTKIQVLGDPAPKAANGKPAAAKPAGAKS
jgi:membrane fusion protein (multidrug efflux system)